ncbi:uncharacterized protein LOC125537708 [Triticum urartu]|uniref:uncharacterized protein LOC125537676 n=1 Tax=Triticum urartu TaxID=4572 RepID=UPI0020431F6F|nr:uncharacterized protein LOC125537676 [Triticum urartu]XP_048556990.1 uncharacterized protein LOC125537708 [Triticum urartu]
MRTTREGGGRRGRQATAGKEKVSDPSMGKGQGEASRTCRRPTGRLVAPPRRHLLCTMRGATSASTPPLGKELEVNRRCGKARGTRSSSLLPWLPRGSGGAGGSSDASRRRTRSMDIVIMVTLSQCIIFGSHIPQGAPFSDSMSDDLRNKRRNNPAEEFGEEEQEKNTFILIGMETPVRIECIIANQLLLESKGHIGNLQAASLRCIIFC